jgi:hypothetical protein
MPPDHPGQQLSLPCLLVHRIEKPQVGNQSLSWRGHSQVQPQRLGRSLPHRRQFTVQLHAEPFAQLGQPLFQLLRLALPSSLRGIHAQPDQSSPPSAFDFPG